MAGMKDLATDVKKQIFAMMLSEGVSVEEAYANVGIVRGPDGRLPKWQGERWLQNRVQEIHAKGIAKAGVDPGEAVSMLYSMAQATLKDYVRDDGTYKGLKELTDEQARNIKKVDIVGGEIVKLELHDQRMACVNLTSAAARAVVEYQRLTLAGAVETDGGEGLNVLSRRYDHEEVQQEKIQQEGEQRDEADEPEGILRPVRGLRGVVPPAESGQSVRAVRERCAGEAVHQTGGGAGAGGEGEGWWEGE